MEVLVKVFDNEAIARLWAGILEEEGITSMVAPSAAAFNTAYMGAFVPHALYVMPNDEARAREILEEGNE